MQLVLPPLPFIRRFSGSRTTSRIERVKFQRNLAQREILSLSPDGRWSIRCVAGSIWITGGNGSGSSDTLVDQGGVIEVTPGALVVIEALQASKVEIASC